MSLRTVFSRVIQQGKWVVKSFVSKPKFIKATGGYQRFKEVRNPVQPLTVNQQQSFFSSVLARYTLRTVIGELRNKPSLGLRVGRLPVFAFGFVGLTFIDKSEEEDTVSQSIRDVFENSYPCKQTSLGEKEVHLSLDNLDFGRLIGKGCNAAIYEVRIKGDENPTQEIDDDSAADDSSSNSDILILDEEIDDSSWSHNSHQNKINGNDDALRKQEGICDDDHDKACVDESHDKVLQSIESEDDIIIVSTDDLSTDNSFEMVPFYMDNSDDLAGTNMFCGNLVDLHVQVPLPELGTSSHCIENGEFDCAVKMMFNYDIDSNSEHIMRAWRKELVPATGLQKDLTTQGCNHLPPHPNIIDIQDVFVDDVPQLPDDVQNYPMALPVRIFPDGHGRNKTMFILMKKYNTTLRDYLKREEQPDIHTRCLLLAQLLEGVVHLKNHGIAHRDLKSDNILLDIEKDDAPQLVIGDFGCCLADNGYGLKIPYQTDEVDRGGIPTLMAPEIACAVPGKNSWLDYSKADLWTVGTLVYELFGMDNPFTDGQSKLDCRKYEDSELPRLPDTVPNIVRLLTEMMLKYDHKQRPSPEVAANIMQIYLWFPDWLNPGSNYRTSDVLNDIMILAAKMLICCHGNNFTACEHLKLTFLKRFRFNDIKMLVNF